MAVHHHCRCLFRAALILAFLLAAAPAPAQMMIPASNADWIREIDQAGARFGRHVAGAGDVNSDGFDDVLVGAPGFDGAFVDSGRVFLYAGGPSGLSTTPSWTFDGDRAETFLSLAIGAGDVNGDGFHDVVVADPGYGDPQGARLLVFHGSAAGLSVAPDAIILGDSASVFLGSRLAAGDVNGDGFSDVASLGSITLHIFAGSPSGLDPAPIATLTETPDSEFLGGPVLRDVTGDGFADLAFTTFDFVRDSNVKESYTCRVRLHKGTAAGLETREARSVSFDLTGGFLVGVGLAGDLDADGFGDLAVSSWGSNEFGFGPPDHVYIHRGSRAGFRPHGEVAHEAQYGTLVPGQVGAAGDVDGDGYDDLIVPERLQDPPSWIPRGRVSIFGGSSAGLGTTPVAILEHELAGDGFGDAAGSAGDVNGDGFDDIVVGAQFFSGGEASEGRAYVFLGGAGF